MGHGSLTANGYRVGEYLCCVNAEIVVLNSRACNYILSTSTLDNPAVVDCSRGHGSLTANGYRVGECLS